MLNDKDHMSALRKKIQVKVILAVMKELNWLQIKPPKKTMRLQRDSNP